MTKSGASGTVEGLKIEVDTLANLLGRLTGDVAGVWVDPHKAREIAWQVIAAGYRNEALGKEA